MATSGLKHQPTPPSLAPDNRLSEIRDMRGLTQKELAARTDGKISWQQIGHIESGRRRLKPYQAEILARALDCAAADLQLSARGLSIPLTVLIASAFSDRKGAPYDLHEPHARIPALPRLKDTEKCFAAQILDDSADRLYPRDSVIIARATAPGERLTLGDKIVVRRYLKSRADGETMEILAGRLDTAVTGEIILIVQSTNREIPPSVTIQMPLRQSGLSERALRMIPRDEAVEYHPRAADPAEIIGRIVLAITPE